MESKDYNAVSFGGFFVNNFALLRDLEGLTFQITKDDIHKFFDTEYNARVGGPADLLVMKVEERGYYACSDGKSMIISPVNIHDKPFGHSYLGFSMGVQQWLYELLPSFLTQSGIIIRSDPVNMKNVIDAVFKIIDGVLFLIADGMPYSIPEVHVVDDFISPSNYID